MKTLTIGEKRYVPYGKLASTLFSSGGTADGEYRKVKGGVHFYKPDGKLFAFLVIRTCEKFFVSAFRLSAVSKNSSDNRPRYMYALTDLDRQALSLPNSFTAENEAAENAASFFAD